jgi:Fe-S-cluster-containing dehydrogenase component
MAKGWNLIVDVAKCHGCYNCVLATKDEHIGNDFPGYSAPEPDQGHHWIRIERKVRGRAPMVDAAYLPTMCNHCDAAPCVQAARGPAVVKRADGIVLISPEHAKGRRDLVDSCPYGAIWWNEELQLPQKWTFDAHLLDGGWKTTRGAQACPTQAMQVVFVDEKEMRALAERERLEVLKPEERTLPRVYYRNLHRFQGAFIGGKVVQDGAGRVDCVAKAPVVLRRGTAEIARTQTDVFGEFKFDGLKCGSGAYTVVAAVPSVGGASRTVELGESVYLGSMTLSGGHALAGSVEEQQS